MLYSERNKNGRRRRGIHIYIRKERGNDNRLCNSQSGTMGKDRKKSGVGPPTDRGVAKKQNRERKEKG